MAKLWGVPLLAAMPVVPYVLPKILPAVSPAGFRMDPFQRVTDVLMPRLSVCLGAAGWSPRR